MRIIYNKDIFSVTGQNPNEAMTVTTNSIVKRNGQAVMGAGIAKAVDQRFHVAGTLGDRLRAGGNHVYHLETIQPSGKHDAALFSFPTKNDWRAPSNIPLIRQSCMELVEMCDELGIQTCYMTPPGCGCGGLYWHDVKTIIEGLLDDRFAVIINR